MAWTRFRQPVPMERSQIQMATACPISKNTSISSPADGTTATPPPCLTTVCGGTAPFPSTTGTKKAPCSSTNPLVVMLVPTAPVPSFSATKIRSATCVRTGLTTTKMDLLTRPTQITTATPTASLTTMTAMATSTKTLLVGTRTATVCPTAGKPLTV